MANVGYATLQVIPSLLGVQAKLSEQLGAPAEQAGKKAGGRFTGALGKVLKTGALAVGAVAGAALGVAIAKGLGRLTAIENAQAKLAGLGHSAKAVETIMGNALAAVKGTAFGLGDAATVAASAVAAGIKPGRDLQRVLGLVGDTASIAGSSLGEMGAIFNKVAASNRLSLGEVNQLADRGVPVLGFLAKQLGVTQGAVSKLVTQGKIDFPTFAKAIEDNIGGAALSSGNTTQGAFANMQAAAGRFGAALLTGVFPIAKIVFGGVTRLTDIATDRIKPFGDALGTAILSRGPQVQALLGRLTSGAQTLATGLREAGPQLRALFDTSWESLSGTLDKLRSVAVGLGPSLLALAGALATAATSVGISSWKILLVTLDLVATVLLAITPAIASLTGWLSQHQGTVTALVGAYTAYKVGLLAVAAVTKTVAAVTGTYRAVTLGIAAASYGAAGATYAQGAALGVYNVITKATMIATKAWAGVQWLLNAALTANPIGLIVVAVAALVAGIIIAYKNSETFRKIVDGALRAVGNAALWLWNNAIKPLWDGIKIAFSAIAGVVTWWWNTVTWPVLSTAMRIITSLGALFWWLFQQAIAPALAAAGVVITATGNLALWLWRNAFKPAIDGIATAAVWLWNNAIRPAFNGIAAGARLLWTGGIKPAFDGIKAVITTAWSVVIKPTFDKVIAIVGKVRSAFTSAFSAIGSVVKGAFNGAVSVLRSALNGLIRLVNLATSGINSMVGALNKVPGVNFPTIPRIPSLAQGGIIPATPGGRLVRVAEAGQAEAVIPLDKLDRGPSAPPEVHVYIGDQELKGLVRVEIRDRDRQTKRRVLAGATA